MGSTSNPSDEVRVIQLEEQNLDGTVYRVEKGDIFLYENILKGFEWWWW